MASRLSLLETLAHLCLCSFDFFLQPLQIRLQLGDYLKSHFVGVGEQLDNFTVQSVDFSQVIQLAAWHLRVHGCGAHAFSLVASFQLSASTLAMSVHFNARAPFMV
jgi:hypothetical protein